MKYNFANLSKLSLEKRILAIGYLNSVTIIAILICCLLAMQIIFSGMKEYQTATKAQTLLSETANRFRDHTYWMQRYAQVIQKGQNTNFSIEKDNTTPANVETLLKLTKNSTLRGKIQNLSQMLQNVSKADNYFRKLIAAQQERKAAAYYMAKYGSLRNDINTLFSQSIQLASEESSRLQSSNSTKSYVAAGLLLTLILAGLFAVLIFCKKTVLLLSGQLDKAMKQLKNQSFQVNETATNISKVSSDLSSTATKQASALHQTAASIEQTTVMINKNAENASGVQKLGNGSYDVALKGKEVIHNMIEGIGELNIANRAILDQVNESNRKISELKGIVLEIGEKTKVINDIAFETKMLSFNASVEAARAGEHGHGFSVVAEQVGNLARMSASASKEIEQMVSSSIQKVEQTINDTKASVENLVADGKKQIDKSQNIAGQCGNVLEEIVNNVHNVNSMVGDITTASQEQASGLNEITKAMSQLDQTTHQQNVVSKQTSVVSDNLVRQAESLQRVVQSLNFVIDGEGTLARHFANEQNPPLPENILSFPVKQTQAPHKSPHKPSPKLAVGADSVPSENDPRFKDV